MQLWKRHSQTFLDLLIPELNCQSPRSESLCSTVANNNPCDRVALFPMRKAINPEFGGFREVIKHFLTQVDTKAPLTSNMELPIKSEWYVNR